MGLNSQDFRQALGQFSTGICVVTAQDEQGQWQGMTINSFASVSLDPALVLWSIQCNSQCLPYFTGGKPFVISVLNAEQQDISNYYATPDQHVVQSTHSRHRDGVIDGALAVFHCDSWADYDGGDHRILVGEVQQATIQTGEPLIFAAGGYRLLAPKA